MYAVIETGGKQYRVAVGDRLKVESLKLEPGARLNLEKVLLLADGESVRAGNPYLGSAVEATVVGHGRGEKVRIFKLRRRQNSRQQAGHRQNYTELEIVSIDGKSDKPAAAKASKAAAPAKKPKKPAAKAAKKAPEDAPAPGSEKAAGEKAADAPVEEQD